VTCNLAGPSVYYWSHSCAEWAKRQLILFCREWYTSTSGALPSYEWNFNDLNPPVHAWACWRVYQISRRVTGTADIRFLERAFHKLMLNFAWWANKKDPRGANLFEGGFLGLDNIGAFCDTLQCVSCPSAKVPFQVSLIDQPLVLTTSAWSRQTPQRGWPCIAPIC
jgi:hypothetical protein